LNFALIPRFGIMGAAYANGMAYALQAAIAFYFSQRFYPISYETGRLARIAIAAVLAYLIASALPAMPPLAGVIVRGVTVVAIMSAGLWIGGFLQPEELAVLERVRRARAPSLTAPPETTELAGEIVATDLPAPDDELAGGARRKQERVR
jgi:peptidoglycan biosynthesis protein MviN/MurJ (putative lipid II flippase)